jgi:hypothetical protein
LAKSFGYNNSIVAIIRVTHQRITLWLNLSWEAEMFYLDKKRQLVLDASKEIVGVIKDGKFRQDSPQVFKFYGGGLTATQLEQVSEAMQRVTIARSR